MTSISLSLPARAAFRPEERIAACGSALPIVLMPIRMVLRGIGLGVIGLAVVLTVTTALIGAQELKTDGPAGAPPAEIRYR